MEDYYSILDIKKTATDEEIKKAYKKAALRNHPDRGGDECKFKEMNKVYYYYYLKNYNNQVEEHLLILHNIKD